MHLDAALDQSLLYSPPLETTILSMIVKREMKTHEDPF
jgi:hypothetical protein